MCIRLEFCLLLLDSAVFTPYLLLLSYQSLGGDVVLVVVASYDELCWTYCDSEMTC